MDNNAVVSKKLVLFIGLIILSLFIILIIYALDDKKKVTNEVTETDDVITTKVDQVVDESIMYGKFVNEKDKYSYLKIDKDGYTYVMNVCEGYATYNSNDFVFTKEITKENGINNVIIKITSNSKEVIDVTFSGSSTDKISQFTGPQTCSESNKYIKTLED